MNLVQRFDCSSVVKGVTTMLLHNFAIQNDHLEVDYAKVLLFMEYKFNIAGIQHEHYLYAARWATNFVKRPSRPVLLQRKG